MHTQIYKYIDIRRPARLLAWLWWPSPVVVVTGAPPPMFGCSQCFECFQCLDVPNVFNVSNVQQVSNMKHMTKSQKPARNQFNLSCKVWRKWKLLGNFWADGRCYANRFHVPSQISAIGDSKTYFLEFYFLVSVLDWKSRVPLLHATYFWFSNNIR